MYTGSIRTISHGQGMIQVHISTVHYISCYSTVQYIHDMQGQDTPPFLSHQCSTVQYSVSQYSTVQCITVQYSTVYHSTVQYITVQCSDMEHIALGAIPLSLSPSGTVNISNLDKLSFGSGQVFNINKVVSLQRILPHAAEVRNIWVQITRDFLRQIIFTWM